MSSQLVNAIANLIIPANLCMMALVIAVVLAWLGWRKTASVLAIGGLAWVLIWSLPVTSLWLGASLEQRDPYQAPADLPHADAIVVLGGNTASGRGNWFLPFASQTAITRVESAAALYQAGLAPVIIVSGGARTGDISEAQIMAYTLRQMGVPREAIILENVSRTTRENAVDTRGKMQTAHIGKILIVTSSLHMPRALATFRQLGIDAVPAPVRPQIQLPPGSTMNIWLPDELSLWASRSIIKEYAGLLLYWCRGWI